MLRTRHSITLIFAAAAAVMMVFPGAAAAAHSHAAGGSGAGAAGAAWHDAGQDALRGPHVFGWGFNAPGVISADGSHVWIANEQDPSSVVELNTATGTLVRVIRGFRYRFNAPRGMSADGAHVWVANAGGNSVTELNAAATGALVKVIRGAGYGWWPTVTTRSPS
jgi:hypothetical protein